MVAFAVKLISLKTNAIFLSEDLPKKRSGALLRDTLQVRYQVRGGGRAEGGGREPVEGKGASGGTAADWERQFWG